MRTPLIAGNWKMHCGPSEARKLALEIRNGVLGSRPDVDIVVCPPFVSIAAVREIVQGSAIGLGAQNAFWETSGAWTGEVAAPMLRDAGCDWVILGHSERRAHFDETDASVRRRLQAVLKSGLRPIVCVGETLDERESGVTERVVTTQVRGGLEGLDPEAYARLTLAYEPVWAIGTGRNATPEQAQDVHRLLRDVLAEIAGAALAAAIRIQYGGSVKPDNAAALLGQPDVDGALVGGASLQAAAFLAIIDAARSSLH